jgi:hypothetical protein
MGDLIKKRNPVATGDKTLGSTSTAVFVPAQRTALALINGWDKNCARNPRTEPFVNCHELTSLTYHANAAALQIAFSAASSTNKAGYVGTSTSYQIFVSDGTNWNAQTGIGAYWRGSVSTSGYKTVSITSRYGLSQTPAGNPVAVIDSEIAALGGVPYANGNGSAAAIGLVRKDGTFTQDLYAAWRLHTSDPLPIVTLSGYNSAFMARIRVNGVWRYLSDPNAMATTTNGGLKFAQLISPGSGGLVPLLFDFTQLYATTPQVAGVGYEVEFQPNNTSYDAFSIRTKHVWLKNYRGPVKSAVIHDSLGATATDGAQAQYFWSWLRDLYGIDDLFMISEAGTGFVNNGGTFRTHIEKLQYLATVPQYADLNHIHLAQSVNDAGQATLVAKMTEAINFATATWPNALITVSEGTAGNSVGSQTTMAADGLLLKALVSSLALPNVVYVPTLNLPSGNPISGTGTFGAPANDGISDFLFNTGDGTHFASIGHKYWATEVLGPNLVTALRSKFASAS